MTEVYSFKFLWVTYYRVQALGPDGQAKPLSIPFTPSAQLKSTFPEAKVGFHLTRLLAPLSPLGTMQDMNREERSPPGPRMGVGGDSLDRRMEIIVRAVKHGEGDQPAKGNGWRLYRKGYVGWAPAG